MDMVAVAVLAWAVVRLAYVFLVEMPLYLRNRPAPSTIMRDFSLYVCYAVIAIILLRTFGDVNLTSLITTSAVLTAVVGLGAQATLSSFFSGLVLQMEKIFEIGDWIQVGDQIGRVSAISWKSTRIITRDGVSVYLPNSDILAGRVSNYSKPDKHYAVHHTIALEYNAPPNTVRQVIKDVVCRHPKVLANPPMEVRLFQFGDFAITYDIVFWTEDCAAESRTRAAINNDLWYALRRHGINIPFPIRDVSLAHIEREHRAKLQVDARKDVAKMLAGVSMLSRLSELERRQIADQAPVLTFAAGEPIVQQGAEGDSMFIIFSGSCEILKEAPGGGPASHVVVLRAGDFFGEMSLLTGERRLASVRAHEDASLIVVSKQLFAEVLTANPETATTLADSLAKRLEGLRTVTGAPASDSTTSSSLRNRIKAFFGIR
jgi:small-conductance mechanosensitive channel